MLPVSKFFKSKTFSWNISVFNFNFLDTSLKKALLWWLFSYKWTFRFFFIFFTIIAIIIPGIPPPVPKSVAVLLFKSTKSIICAESIIWRSLITWFFAVSWLIILISLFLSVIIDMNNSKSKYVSRETFKLLSLEYKFKISCSIKLYA